MFYKKSAFIVMSVQVFGGVLISHATSILWLNIASIILIIGGLVTLNIYYHKALRRLIKFDKDFFKHPYESM
jgi:hypothetical protein